MRGKRWNLMIDEINMTERSRAWIREKAQDTTARMVLPMESQSTCQACRHDVLVPRLELTMRSYIL